MHHQDYEDLVENHALSHWPDDNSIVYIVADRDRAEVSNGDGTENLAFADKKHAIAAATALSNGNVPHCVLECRVVARIECTAATAKGRKLAKTKATYTGAYK